MVLMSLAIMNNLHQHREALLKLALDSIDHGLNYNQPLPVALGDYPQTLQTPAASFVTLHVQSNLRGCIGTLEAFRPLALDVVANAYAAAFRDPRFPPLSRLEFKQLDIHISVLSSPEDMHIAGEADLLAQLLPGIDGLIIEEDCYRSTFLPTVWESLPQPEDFLRQLKLKAGLPADYWSKTIRARRYTVQSVE